MPDTLTITDNRTGRSYEVPIIYGTYPEYGAAIPAKELRKIKQSDSDFGMLAFDPGFTTTASCRTCGTPSWLDQGLPPARPACSTGSGVSRRLM